MQLGGTHVNVAVGTPLDAVAVKISESEIIYFAIDGHNLKSAKINADAPFVQIERNFKSNPCSGELIDCISSAEIAINEYATMNGPYSGEHYKALMKENLETCPEVNLSNNVSLKTYNGYFKWCV